MLASPRALDMWSNLPNVTRDACGVFVQRFPKELIVRRSAYLSVFHHHLRRVVALAPFIFFSPLAVLVFPSSFSYMPDISPSTPAVAQPSTTTSSSSSINAQFLNAVTRGDEHHARSLLARGADVNAMDAAGRSAVACVLAGERCAAVRVFPPRFVVR
jgi:hypothetical protein